MPRMTTVSPARAPLLRRALKVVMPAHSSGAGVDVAEVVRDQGDGVGGGDDVVGVAAVVVDAGDVLIFAKDEVAAAAGMAVVAMAAVPAQTDALAGLEDRDLGANRVEHTGDLVAGNARVLDAGPYAQLGKRIAVANTAGLDTDTNVPRTRLGKFALDNLEVSAGGGHLHGTASH